MYTKIQDGPQKMAGKKRLFWKNRQILLHMLSGPKKSDKITLSLSISRYIHLCIQLEIQEGNKKWWRTTFWKSVHMTDTTFWAKNLRKIAISLNHATKQTESNNHITCLVEVINKYMSCCQEHIISNNQLIPTINTNHHACINFSILIHYTPIHYISLWCVVILKKYIYMYFFYIYVFLKTIW